MQGVVIMTMMPCAFSARMVKKKQMNEVGQRALVGSGVIGCLSCAPCHEARVRLLQEWGGYHIESLGARVWVPMLSC